MLIGEYDAMAVAQALSQLYPSKSDDTVITVENTITNTNTEVNNNNTKISKQSSVITPRKKESKTKKNITLPSDVTVSVLSKLPFHDIPTISLPNGCNSLPPELISRLERFETIYLWMDNDKSGRLC